MFLSLTTLSSQDDDSYICTKAERHLNLPFSDIIDIVKADNHSRILFQIINSLEISTGQLTLKNTCDGISSYEIDIAYLAETNTHWKHPRGASTLRQISKRHWKYSHFITSETDLPWKALYKPGGIAIITQQPLCNGITSSVQDPHGLGRWSFITISGREQPIITIISVYRVCDIQIQNAGPITNAKQQWQILEERNEEHKDIYNKTIIDLSNYINALTQK